MRDEDMLKKIYTDGIASKKKQSDPISTPRDVK
jgi:hypothetical protein